MAKTSGPQSERQTARLPVDANGDGAASPRWVRYSVYLAQKIKAGLSPDAADREIRHELDEGWWHFRYLGIDGRPYIDDLPSGYAWSDAKVGLGDSGVWPAKAEPPAVAPLADIARTFQAVDVALGRAARPRRQLAVYRIEVRVPTEAPETPTPTDPKTPTPAPEPPRPMEPKRWVEQMIKQREPDETVAEFAERVAPLMATAKKDKKVKRAWKVETIQVRISEFKLGW